MSRTIVDAHERATARFVDLVASLRAEPRPVPGLAWNTIEVAAHELSVFRGYQRAMTRNVGRPIRNGAASSFTGDLPPLRQPPLGLA
jgi:hypothetical protein